MGEHVDRGVEQHRPLDALRLARGQLVDEPAAVGVADPRGAADARGVHRLEQVVELLRDRPGRLPLGAAVAAEVRRQDAMVRQRLLRQPPVARAVGGDAVEADDGRRVRVAPFVQVERHQNAPASASTSSGSSSLQSPARPTSASRSSGDARSKSIAAITCAFTEPVRCSKPPSAATAT